MQSKKKKESPQKQRYKHTCNKETQCSFAAVIVSLNKPEIIQNAFYWTTLRHEFKAMQTVPLTNEHLPTTNLVIHSHRQ